MSADSTAVVTVVITPYVQLSIAVISLIALGFFLGQLYRAWRK